MAAKFQNPSGNPQQAKAVIVQQNINEDTSSAAAAAQSVTSKTQKGGSYIEDRQNKINRVLEQFIKEATRKGEMTAAHENKIRESFNSKAFYTLQLQDILCQKTAKQVNTNTDTSRLYYIDTDGILRKLLEDNEEVFNTVVLPKILIDPVLQLAHDVAGHNRFQWVYLSVR